MEDSGIVEADVVLVLGRDFGGVTPPPGAMRTTAGGTTPTTAASAPAGVRGRHDRGTAARPDPVLLTRRDAERLTAHDPGATEGEGVDSSLMRSANP